MTELIFNFILPIWLIGLIPVGLIGTIVGFLGEQFEMTKPYKTHLSARGKIQATKFFVRDLPLWPIATPVYAFYILKKFRKSYLGWKDEANEEAIRDVSIQLDKLESYLERSKRLNSEAIEARSKYKRILTKYGK